MKLYDDQIRNYIKEIQSVYAKPGELDSVNKDFISQLYCLGTPSNEIEKMENTIKRIKSPNIYQNGIDTLTLNELSSLLEEAKEVLGFSNDMPPIAILHMYSFSARIMLPDVNRSEVIFISSGLLNFLFSISKIIVQSLEIIKEDEHIRVSFDKTKIANNVRKKQLKKDFVKIITTYYYSNTCLYTGTDGLRYEQAEVLAILVKTMRCFVIAHEYSHLLLGHTKKKRPINAGSISIKLIEQSWEDEKSADQLGHMLTNIAMYNCGIDQPYSLWGGYLFIKILEVFEIFQKIIKNQNVISVTHPPASERKMLYYDSILEESVSVMNNLMIPAFDFIFQLLLKDIEVILFDIQNKCNSNMTIEELLNVVDDLYNKV